MSAVNTLENLRLTEEMFEASKILAPAIARGRADLFFDGYGARKWLSIRGTMNAGKNHSVRVIMCVEFKKTIHQYTLTEYMSMEWDEMITLLRLKGLENEPKWICLNG